MEKGGVSGSGGPGLLLGAEQGQRTTVWGHGLAAELYQGLGRHVLPIPT